VLADRSNLIQSGGPCSFLVFEFIYILGDFVFSKGMAESPADEFYKACTDLPLSWISELHIFKLFVLEYICALRV